MYLKKIYTEPITFKPVEFKPGINFIYGKKEKLTDSKKSLNNIGKSTFLDLIDFALLSNFNIYNKRLYSAYQKGILKGKSVILELEFKNQIYLIKRSFDKPNNNILFGLKNKKLAPYTLSELKLELCDLLFRRENYEGYYSNTWLRKLIPFYLKIHKHKKEAFVDPIKYIKESTETELIQYHLFLMDINNDIAHRNFLFQTKLKKIEPAIKEIKNFFEERYDLNLSENRQAYISSQIRALEKEVKELENFISSFQLHKNYEINEIEANKLTEQIKKLWFQNYTDKKRIEAYQNSISFDDIKLQTWRIEKLYSEFNQLLGERIKKTLDEAINFKKELILSRKEFLKDEIKKIENRIEERKKLINELATKRARIFKYLSNQKAIDDLSEAYYQLSEKKMHLAELKNKVDIFRELQKEKNKIEQEIKKIEGEIIDFEVSIEEKKNRIAALIEEIYNAIYPEYSDTLPIFDINSAPQKESKIEISLLNTTMMFGKGKNQGRTLIYDLAILFNSIDNNLKAPRFLVHDGIFDGVDKAHFVHLYKYLQDKLSEAISKDDYFQYIITYNQEGTLTEEFGNMDVLNNEKIEQEAILVLTPNKKLLGEF